MSSALGGGSNKRLSAVDGGDEQFFPAWLFTLPGAVLLGADGYALLASFM